MNEFNSIYVGMDVHKARIAIAVAQTGRGEAVYYGEIENTQAALNKPAGNRTPTGEQDTHEQQDDVRDLLRLRRGEQRGEQDTHDLLHFRSTAYPATGYRNPPRQRVTTNSPDTFGPVEPGPA